MPIEMTCPKCGEKLEVSIPLDDGPPDEAGEECNCGAIPIWRVSWDYVVWLEEYLYDEREKYAKK